MQKKRRYVRNEVNYAKSNVHKKLRDSTAQANYEQKYRHGQLNAKDLNLKFSRYKSAAGSATERRGERGEGMLDR